MIGDDDEPEIDADPSVPSDEAAVDSRAYERKLNEQELRMAEAKSFWTQALAHPIGRRELWAILQRCGAFETPFAVSPVGFPDHEAAWFRAGQYSLGQSLLISWLNHDRVGTLQMLAEHHPQLQAPPKPKRRKRD